jgi:hypothetical protein
MLEIERVSWLKRQYTVRDDAGHAGTWTRPRLRERMDGDVDGEGYELLPDGSRRFSLVQAGAEVASAEAAKRGRWTISAGERTYELGRKSAWRSEFELRSDGRVVGSIRRAKGARARLKLLCDLPGDLPPATQAFIGFVALTMWDRAATDAASAGA